MTKEIKPIKLKAEVMWAYLNERNEMSNAYQVDLCQLSKAAVDALSEMGVEAQHKDGKGFFINCKSKNYPIEALNPDGSRINADIRIGNGSKVTAVVGSFDWTFKNKKGTSASLKKLVVTDLVQFMAGDIDATDVDGTIEEMESDVL